MTNDIDQKIDKQTTYWIEIKETEVRAGNAKFNCTAYSQAITTTQPLEKIIKAINEAVLND